MRNRLFLAIFFLLAGLYSFAATYQDWWLAGNRFYQQKQYDSAAFYYEKIATLKPHDAVIYYNLGNTYYKQNQVGPAVLNYERALHIDPNYTAAKDNLLLTQSRINNRILSANDIFFVRWWQAATQGDKATTWAVLSVVLFIILIIGLLLRRFGRGNNLFPPQAILLFSLVWLVCLLLSFSSAMRGESAQAVIMQNDVPLMGSELRGKPLSLLPEGTTVEVRDEKQEWVEVRLPDGRSGWIQKNTISKV